MTSMISNKKEVNRFIRFAVVGTIGAVIDFGIFNLLIQVFNFVALSAQVISFSVAVISNFTWNRLWTYPDSRNKPIARQLMQFVVVSLIGLGIRTLIFGRIEDAMVSLAKLVLPSNFIITPVSVGHNLSLAFVIILILFWNFFVNRVWTYNDVN
ncbi:MAG TPA: GtrA family protein [Anaerolineaceae bacterium]|nr:GtrA family protein [Anaerolineaceae bacterium]